MDEILQLTPARCTRKLSFDDVLAGKYPAGHKAEVKEDDCRYLLHIDPLGNGRNYLTSRRISKQTGRFVEKQDWCPFIRDFRFPRDMRGVVLDGGIYKPGLVSTDVVRAMRQGEGVSYVCWDILHGTTNQMTDARQKVRWSILAGYSSYFPDWLHLSKKHDDPVKLLRKIDAENGEGIVLKDPDALYGYGWTKVKRKETFDVIILGFNKPTSEIYAAKGWIGQIICGQIKYADSRDYTAKVNMFDHGASIRLEDGQHYWCVFVANVKNMTDELRAKISANPSKYIGRVLTLSAQEQLKSGKLRNPSVIGLRDDKEAVECTLRIGQEA